MLQSVLILVILILINAFFAMSEIALISVNETKLRLRMEEGDKKAEKILDIVSNPSNFLSTIQIGISLAGMLSGAFAAQSFADVIIVSLVESGVTMPVELLNKILILVITFIMSFFMLVLGELVPKQIAMYKTEEIADFVVYPISAIAFIATPFVKVLSLTTNVILRIFKIDPDADDADVVSEEEFRHIMKKDGSFLEIEKERIDNIFEFDDKIAEDIATHRKDMVSLSLDASKDEILQVALDKGFSRIPVYDDTVDNIVGILYVKDLLEHMLDAKNSKQDVDLTNILREPYFVPVSKKTDVLFEEMKKNKVHMSVAVDEYGGTMGIVTMEDLIEEIMGNILDEYDAEEIPDVMKLSDSSYLIQGSAMLEDVEEILDLDLPEDDYETFGGFVIGILGQIPNDGEQLETEYEGYRIEVLKVDNRRIEKVRVSKLPKKKSKQEDIEIEEDKKHLHLKRKKDQKEEES